jgi:thiosulfate/3-mercaptopyruvate sulfurtransferase
VLSQIGDSDSIVWDARALEEYTGTKVTALKNGHIPGAVNLDWLELIDHDSNLRLKPLDILKRKLESLGIDKNKKIITHCQTHHRSGLSYLVGKILGLDIKAYDGSWSEWGNHPDTPVER